MQIRFSVPLEDGEIRRFKGVRETRLGFRVLFSSARVSDGKTNNQLHRISNDNQSTSAKRPGSVPLFQQKQLPKTVSCGVSERRVGREVALSEEYTAARCELDFVIPARVVYLCRLLLAEAHGLFHSNRKLSLEHLHVLVRRQVKSVEAIGRVC